MRLCFVVDLDRDHWDRKDQYGGFEVAGQRCWSSMRQKEEGKLQVEEVACIGAVPGPGVGEDCFGEVHDTYCSD